MQKLLFLGRNKLENEIKIAVLEEQIRGLREQQKAHSERTETLFKELFTQNYEIFESLNKGKGAFAFAVIFAGIIGATTVKFIHAFFR